MAMKNFPQNRFFRSPVLIKELDKVYGSESQKEEIALRESPDIGKFLVEKQKAQRKSEEVNYIFR